MKNLGVAILICLASRVTFQEVTGNQENILLFSTTKDIRVLNTTKGLNFKQKSIPIVENQTQIIPVDYNVYEEEICWSDTSLQSILCGKYNKHKITEKVRDVREVVSQVIVDRLACDWVTKKIYWTDSETNHIEVVTNDGKYRKVLFWTDLDQPRAIALAPKKGLMFWSDWGETPKIERAGMNGDQKTRKVIVSENIFWPNGLSIDHEAEKIYWMDGKFTFLKRMDFDGGNLTTILEHGIVFPFALTHFKNKFYWTDWKTTSLVFYDINLNRTAEIEHIKGHSLMDIHVFDERKQERISTPCDYNNGNCSHLCLLSPDPPYFSCGCPIGTKLIDNYTCPEGPEEMLLVARRNDICKIYLDSPDYTYKVIPVKDIVYSIAIDFDPVEQTFYWSDDEVKKIQSAKLDGSDQRTIVVNDVGHPDGIALDWLSRNIYWADSGTDRIEVARIKTPFRRTIISTNLTDPRGIAVAPSLGWMFWSDWNDKLPKIERANLDGSDRLLIIYKKLGWPNGITLDIEVQKIYWCDAKLDKIEYANMDGSERMELISEHVPHIFGISLFGNYIYWTDWQNRVVDRADKITGLSRKVIADQMENIMGLKAISLKVNISSNPCKVDNGGCLQFCFYRNTGGKICSCQIDFELSNDGKTCIKPEAFILYTRKNVIGRLSISNSNNVTIPIAGLKDPNSIDYDVNTQRIFWSDTKSRSIMKAYINGSDLQKVIDVGLASPEGIAIDWLALNIYWTDSAAHRIEVARLIGSSRRTLVWGLDDPRSIVLDPMAGYMYWSNWGSRKSIKRAGMDGNNVTDLILTAGDASSLTLDYERKRLYWTESNRIMSSDLDGNDKMQVVLGEAPKGLSLYKETLYWSDMKTNGVYKANLDGSDVVKIHSLPEPIADLVVYHESKKEQSNPCSTSNGGCTQLCLTLPPDSTDVYHVRYTCACQTHYILKHNECLPPTHFMLYSQKNLVVRLVPGKTESLEAVFPIQGLKGVRAIDYDPIQEILFWIDGKPSIKASKVGGAHSVIVPSHPQLHPFDLVCDPINQLIFWSCALQNVINITRFDGSVLGHLDRKLAESPRHLAIHVKKRLLFFTDNGTQPQLVRTRLDGTHKIVICKDSDIDAIAVDQDYDLIVWARGQNLYAVNIDGGNKPDNYNGEASQITVHAGWLYWIDKKSHDLQSVMVSSGLHKNAQQIQASHITDLISVEKPLNHSCNHYLKCTHFCIMKENNPTCACPDGYVLHTDKRKCTILPNCGIDKFTCTLRDNHTKDCIPINWKCDGQKDCSDGSDEMDCPKCSSNQFRCQDGACIENSQVCDDHQDCSDNSDEKACCNNGFQCPQTQTCLQFVNVCDGYEHCADGADENRAYCEQHLAKKKSTNTVILVISGVIFIIVLMAVVFYCQRKKFFNQEDDIDQSDSLSPMHPSSAGKSGQKFRKGIPDVVKMSMIGDGCSSTYDRRHITGASSSSITNGSTVACYPRETLNPPPSPATTAASTRGSSPLSRYRPYRHYRSINQPPPPTPCSTDVCDESDYNYPAVAPRSRYNDGPFPPPPTPRSHCHNDSCPPSPSSRSSTYFSPLPPPPSPVALPREDYDS